MAVDMLKEKYGEAFEIYSRTGREWTEDFYKIIACPEESPDILFEAKVACDGSWIEDEYVAVSVCRRAEEVFLENAGEMGGCLEVKIRPVSRSTESSDAKMSLKEFLEKKPGNRFAVYLYYCPEGKHGEELYDIFQNVFRGLEVMSGNIQMYVVDEETLQRMKEYWEEHAVLYYGGEQIVDKFPKITLPFQKGKLEMTREEFLKETGGKL